MNETHVTVVGNLVADPVQRSTKTGDRSFTTFRIASTPRRRDAQGAFVSGPTSFYSVVAFNSVGANARLSFHKGDTVIVVGRQRVTEWQTAEGRDVVTVEIDAQHLGHDLTWGRSTYTKVRSQGWAAGDRTDDSEVREAIGAGLGEEPGPRQAGEHPVAGEVGTEADEPEYAVVTS